ncbi:zinc finger, C3HC4 type [Ancylostoma caninum]|uniref:Zinc finger, C3HC4 type n=1 Tax=Ancylostoma caninum TaxID=29170 RepID=A0A368GPH2_ANCCA|nr:zinc finger, C3HC4 type [Ancylostoma caninum]
MAACQSSYEAALKINNVLTKIQSELKCGVCRSTFSNPVVATCVHTFCKDCLNQVFQLRRCIECPLCRKDIKKRSCTPSEQQDALVKGYLQLGRIFREEIQNQSLFIPKDIAYIESQVPAAEASNLPICDFRPEPQFALPKARARRKQPLTNNANSKVSRMDPISEESECKENTPLQKATKAQDNEVHPVKIKANILARRTGDDLVRYARSKSVEVQCDFPDPACICRDLHSSLRCFIERSSDRNHPSDLHALFAMMPEYKKLLEENLSTLYELLPPPRYDQDFHAYYRSFLEMGKMLSSDCEASIFNRNSEGLPDDVCSGELMETQPSPCIAEGLSLCIRKDAEKDDEATPSQSRPASDVVLQSPQSSNDDMEITLHANFESFPEDITPTLCNGKTTTSTSSSMVISVSRLSCIEDDDLVRQFLSLFETVGFNQEVTSTTTHLVMMNSQKRSCQRRSLRYVYAIAHKCELLSRCWLEECVQYKSLLPTSLHLGYLQTQYTLTSESSSDPPSWLLSKSSKTPLFDQVKFFLPKSFSDSQLLPRQKLMELISICGGSCYDKPWEVDGAQRAYTIFMPRSREWDAAYRYEASMNSVPVLAADWVLDSIAQYRLLPIDSYRVRRHSPSSG